MILCWFYRKLISLDPEEQDRCSARIRRHLASCAACRQFHAVETSLARRLRQEAPSVRVSPSPFLAGRIAGGTRRAELAREPDRLSGLLWWGGAGAAVALAALSAGIIWQGPAPRAPGSPPSLEGSLRSFDFALPDGERLLKMSEALDRPLDGEIQLVVNDARTAVQALAQNFLPRGLE